MVLHSGWVAQRDRGLCLLADRGSPQCWVAPGLSAGMASLSPAAQEMRRAAGADANEVGFVLQRGPGFVLGLYWFEGQGLLSSGD